MKKAQTLTGLSAAEVEESRRRHGANVLTPPARTPLWRLFLDKFGDPVIRILLVALLASVGIAAFEYSRGGSAEVFLEPGGIFLAVILATGIGFWFETKAGRAFDLLNQVSDEDPVQVVRGGQTTEVPRRDIVTGDIVVLSTGVEIPADGTLVEAVSLQVNESTLTGEPVVKKSADPADHDPEATYPTGHVMRGTTVVEGHGIMRVDHVGDATEHGRVFTAAQIDNSVKTPLSLQLDRLGHVITRISYVLAALVLAGRIGLYLTTVPFDTVGFTAYLLQTVMVAVTLVVVAVPEGLPMAVTLALALSMRRMLRTQNLVRRMHACETMGATTVICTDKTGTLTQNQMRVSEIRFYGQDNDSRLPGTTLTRLMQEGMAVNSTALLDTTGPAPKVMGNPTEGALLLWLRENGADYAALREAAVEEQLTFSTERKYMATVVHSQAMPGRRILYVKGAPEIVASLCRDMPAGLSREALARQLAAYQGQAMRTLGFAYQLLADGDATIAGSRVTATGLTFAGVAAIADPVRAEVPAAVASCLRAGIDIKIVTGDTPLTAREIGRQIGLWKPAYDERNIITGPELAALSDEELARRADALKIIARARPMDKKRLVETLQKNGHVVAVTGDGTNDAPALKAAHVGLSMGDGTSVAKEASDITIMDNSFSSITRAVQWGRSLYRNIQRFVLFQMTINVAACLTVLAGAFTGTESPLTVTQMLWVNLIMDTFAAMALASLPPSADVMLESPRSQSAFIITRPMWAGILGMGVAFTAVLGGVLHVFRHHTVSSLTDLSWLSAPAAADGLSAYEGSVFFTAFVLLQFWNMFNARAFATGRSAFAGLGACRSFLLVAAAILAGQVLIVGLGGRMFGVTPLPAADWLVLLLVTSPVLLLGELKRAVGRRTRP